jgi:hypothetical protein
VERLSVVKIDRISKNYGYNFSNSVIIEIYNDLSTYNQIDLDQIIDELEWWSDKQKQEVM